MSSSRSVTGSAPLEVRAAERATADFASITSGWALVAMGVLPLIGDSPPSLPETPEHRAPFESATTPTVSALARPDVGAKEAWTEALRLGRAARPREPRTALGRRLLALRAKIVESGVPLLNWDEVEREAAERRAARENEA